MCSSSIIIVILLHTTAAQQPTPLHARVVDLIVLDPDLRLLTFLRNSGLASKRRNRLGGTVKDANSSTIFGPKAQACCDWFGELVVKSVTGVSRRAKVSSGSGA